MENLRNRSNLKLINDKKKLKKWVSQPSFERFEIFDENLIAVVNKKTSLLMNRPIYAGKMKFNCVINTF